VDMVEYAMITKNWDQPWNPNGTSRNQEE